MPSIFLRTQRLLKPFSGQALEAEAQEKRGAALLRRLGRADQEEIDRLAKRIILPSLPVADEDMARLNHWEMGRQLARQDEWEKLADMITSADDARLATPGGVSEAALLAAGAQSDVVAAATDALSDGAAPDPSGLLQMEEALADVDDNHAIAMVAAMAHIHIGRAWRTEGPEERRDTEQRHHFKRAEALLMDYDAVVLDAPSLAALQCSLTELLCPDPSIVARAYHRLLALDPHAPGHMRAFGLALLQAGFVNETLLDREARRIAQETPDIWGKGAYTWIYLDVLARNAEALETVDAALFEAGLRDILRRKKDQHITNELAAFCAISMAPREEEASKNAARTRARLHGCLDFILSDHLQELHPLIWCEAQQFNGPQAPRANAPRALVAQGRQRALRVIAQRFADQLADGSSIAFSPAGMYRLPAI